MRYARQPARENQTGWRRRTRSKVGNDNGTEELKKISGVRDVVTDGEQEWKRFSLRVESGADVREEVFRLAVERHWAVRELTQRRGHSKTCSLS